VIICEIIVQLLVIAQNKKNRQPIFRTSELSSKQWTNVLYTLLDNSATTSLTIGQKLPRGKTVNVCVRGRKYDGMDHMMIKLCSVRNAF